jgi:hypothetical protein
VRGREGEGGDLDDGGGPGEAAPPDEAGGPGEVARPDAPVFVIGAPRSGTTLLRLILDSHPRISCGEETHFLRDLGSIVGRHWDLVATYGFDRAWWVARIARFYATFQADVLARTGKARWAEKDPTYTLILELVDELFPDAVYVHLVRDGHDVVASFRDRWGYRSAVRAARGEWARYVRSARTLGARLPRERFLELRYERLVADPAAEARGLFDFLGEAWHPEVLDFDPAEHTATERYRRFTASRRQAAGETATIYRSRVGAGRAGLDPFLRALLRRGAGDLLDELGYAGGADGRSTGA